MSIRRILSVGLVAALAMTAVEARAQSLSVAAAVDAAVSANPEMAVARIAVEEAEQRVRQARAGFLPSVEFLQAWQRGNQPVFVFSSLLAQRQFGAADFALGALNHPEAVSNARSAFVLDYALFDGGRTRAAVRISTVGVSLARSGERQARDGMALAVARAYGRAVRAGADKRAAESAVAVAEEDVRVAEARRTAGTATDADVLGLQAHLAAMQSRVIDVTSEERIARADLNRLMDRALDEPIVLQPLPPAALASVPLEELQARAKRQRPELEQASLQMSLASAQRADARAAVMPHVGFQGGYEWNDGGRGTPASSWVAGAQVRVNLFAGGAHIARIREAALAARRAEIERERMDRAVELEVLTAAEQLASAHGRRGVAQAAVMQARESQRIVRDRFEAGLAPAGDVVRAATALLEAESRLIGAEADTIVSEAALRRAVGGEEVQP